MADDPRVPQLLEEILDSGHSPDEVCRACPELLPQVRERWQRLRSLQAQIGALFPEPESTMGPGHTPTLPPASDFPRIPGYEVQAVLGHGGMGVVYKAWHQRLNRAVALKMLLAGAYAPPEELERFLREAEAVAGLRHANIVQVHDVGDLAGRPYFTMEYVEGGSLAQKLAGTPQPAGQAAAQVATVAEAIQVAHHSGIVHRDLKSANILLTADGTPKITDFGLARRLEDGGELTVSGVPVGTPSYMAPEQAQGQRDAIGPATDVYALGGILYEMLTGRPPFRAETAAATLQQVLAEDPVPPSRRKRVTAPPAARPWPAAVAVRMGPSSARRSGRAGARRRARGSGPTWTRGPANCRAIPRRIAPKSNKRWRGGGRTPTWRGCATRKHWTDCSHPNVRNAAGCGATSRSISSAPGLPNKPRDITRCLPIGATQ